VNGHPPSGQGRSNRQSTGYSRYDQEVFRSEPAADFQIETNLSFHGTNYDAIRSGNPTSLNDTSFTQPSGSSNTAFHQRNGNSQPVQRPGFGPPSAVHPKGRPLKKVSKTPIIVIPASGTALITRHNARDILQVCF
jgi:parafibromin